MTHNNAIDAEATQAPQSRSRISPEVDSKPTTTMHFPLLMASLTCVLCSINKLHSRANYLDHRIRHLQETPELVEISYHSRDQSLATRIGFSLFADHNRHMADTASVVGGSLTDLINGIVLKKIGFQVHVLERSATKSLESQAAGMRVGPEVCDFIQQYGRPSSEYFITAEMIEIMDGERNVEQKMPSPQPLRLTTWKIVYDLLKDTLLQSVDGEHVATYKTLQVVQNVDQAGNKSLNMPDVSPGVGESQNQPSHQRLEESCVTVINDKPHQTTVPRGKMSPTIWQRVLDRRSSVVVNPYFADLMGAIEEPFVSAINDFEGQKAVLWDGNCHWWAMHSVSVDHMEVAAQAFQGEMTLQQWEEKCLESAKKAAQFILVAADLFWNGKLAKAASEAARERANPGGDTS
ncbi:hypothetical protein DE146DRAFT_769854 [Phaeosphaeria sp. MPI-PUGE-AT-0046c]|nr:hypothetical protein DE146DRAFT_769854 [Phaeosphaeria sp. MPI-PUGE-AT-0046c]